MGSYSITIKADKDGIARYLLDLAEEAGAASKAAKPGTAEVAKQAGIAQGLQRAVEVITRQWKDTGKAEPEAANGHGPVTGRHLAPSGASPLGDDPRPGGL